LIWRLSSNQFSRNVREDAISGASVAAIDSTNALIVTNFRDMQARTTCRIARVYGTCIVVITINRSVNTISGSSITSISCTFVCIITLNLFDITLSSCKIASRWETFVYTLADNRGIDTSSNCITSINSTCIVVVAKSWSLDKISSQAITRVGVTFVLLSKSFKIIFRCVDASLNSVAGFLSASVNVSAGNRSMNTVSTC